MNQPSDAKTLRRFIPPAARISAVGAIASVIVGIAFTAFSWLFFKSASPAIAIATGAAAGGLVLVGITRQRRKNCPPSLMLDRVGVVIEDRHERIIIPWEELAEVRQVVEDVERLEFRSKFSTEPFILVVDHFSPEQAAEIRRSLLPQAA
jgi:hypothetical protein